MNENVTTVTQKEKSSEFLNFSATALNSCQMIYGDIDTKKELSDISAKVYEYLQSKIGADWKGALRKEDGSISVSELKYKLNFIKNKSFLTVHFTKISDDKKRIYFFYSSKPAPLFYILLFVTGVVSPITFGIPLIVFLILTLIGGANMKKFILSEFENVKKLVAEM